MTILPKGPNLAEWLTHPYTKAVRRQVEKDLEERTNALHRACRNSTDPAVRETFARFEETAGLHAQLKLKPGDDDE
jgi:hypothetical protein